jgi:branched-chain amino acid transport system ATP-binding protein
MLLDVKNIIVRHGGIEAVKGVSLTVEEGMIVSLIGANGAGKSSLLKAISGLNRSINGEIWFRGKRIDGWKPAKIVKAGIAQVPEGGRIFSKLTVEENLRTGAYLRRDHAKLSSDYERVYALFGVLKERLIQKAGTLSGGERQMLAFGRALMNGPKLLLLDEPSLGLAPILVDEIFRVIQKIRDEGVTVLLVEQNAKKALELADVAYVFETGHIVLQGPAKELMDSREVQQAYLGG